MADTTLSPTNLVQVEVGASEDTWGTKLNANEAIINAWFDAGPALKIANGGTGATSASAARTALGVAPTGTSGATVPLLNAANTWSAAQSFTVAAIDLQVGQIAFPATQNASSNANTLDDYEEGTWTPTLTAASVAPTGVTYSTQSARYTKIGRVVHIEGRVGISSKGSGGSGTVRIGGLPFSIGSANAAGSAVVVAGANMPSGYQANLSGGTASATVLVFTRTNNTSLSNLDWATEINGDFDVVFSISYVV